MTLRYFETVPIPGELVYGRDGGGWRHFLNGLPVRCGTGLECWDASRARWVAVRYESTLYDRDAVAKIYVDGLSPFFEAKETDRFRWPARKGEPRRRPGPMNVESEASP